MSEQLALAEIDSSNSNNGFANSIADRKTFVRLVIISDTHGYHRRLTESLPEGDILIHLGDFCNKGSPSDALDFSMWITELATNSDLKKHPHYEEIFVIEGNHDRTLLELQNKGEKPLDLQQLFSKVFHASDGRVRFLQDEIFQSERHQQLRFYGASWDSCAGDNFPRTFDGMEGPPDVMLAHVNPHLSHSITSPQLKSVKHARAWLGSPELGSTVLDNRVPLCLSGHVHWGRGVISVSHNNNTDFGDTSNSVFINAATLKTRRHGGILNEAVVVDYDLEQRKPIRIHCPVIAE